MLFAISGSQGSGKSSVIAQLSQNGFQTTQRKISRSIMKDWNVTLPEVNSDVELTLRFQDELLIRKHTDEQIAVASDDIWFTERTFMDSFSYYMFAFGNQSTMSDHISRYYARCVEYDALYSGVFYIPRGVFPVVDDGVRATNPLYSESIDVVMQHFINNTINDVHRVTSTSVDDRVAEITKIVRKNR